MRERDRQTDGQTDKDSEKDKERRETKAIWVMIALHRQVQICRVEFLTP